MTHKKPTKTKKQIEKNQPIEISEIDLDLVQGAQNSLTEIKFPSADAKDPHKLKR